MGYWYYDCYIDADTLAGQEFQRFIVDQLMEFNNKPTQSIGDEYHSYISSIKWKVKRNDAIKRAGYKCQGCGLSKWSVELEVHHKTYKNFGNELDDDLEVLCPDCHKIADQKRVELAQSGQFFIIDKPAHLITNQLKLF